jgi:Tol biopolymer transport system component
MLARFISSHRLIPVACTAALLAGAATATAASGPTTERVSVKSNGDQAKRESRGPSVSGTGRFVAFTSVDRQLTGPDTNGWIDVYVRDRAAGTTKRVSLSSGGKQPNDQSDWPSISSDGRYVAFESKASNLARGDRGHGWDVFVRDLKQNTTTLVSIQRRGAHGGTEPSISADGRSVAFVGASGGIFVRRLTTHRTERVTSGATPSLSGDGRIVAFTMYEEFKTPIPSSGTDVFVRDLKTRRTEQVSVSPHPKQTAGFSAAPEISADGRFVAFTSVVDLITGDRNGTAGVYRRDLTKHTTQRVSVSSNGEKGDNGGFTTAISANGRFVAFDSYATNLVPDDTNQAEDVFVRDVVSGTTTRVSVTASGEQTTSASGELYETTSENAAISGDGRFVAFQSRATNLVEGDTNGVLDVFIRGPLQP